MVDTVDTSLSLPGSEDVSAVHVYALPCCDARCLCTCVSVLVAVSCQLYACVATAVHNAAVIALRVEWRRA